MSDSNLLLEPLPTGWENLQFYDVCDLVKDSYQPVNVGREYALYRTGTSCSRVSGIRRAWSRK